ncbi:kinase-like domain-containing protein [Polychytrium aggregatum]|uniref:kinase-like domain-containing protein n=1 Tax=Polychytrium aggregatum TaxID=110093 RepID=UPI0022FE0848|nr:kinase-like domain-containing protein [Polychytrium aggregatum]KAI9193100.1 kinase-like domain-containing protein [Polychytrium aggregatum]
MSIPHVLPPPLKLFPRFDDQPFLRGPSTLHPYPAQVPTNWIHPPVRLACAQAPAPIPVPLLPKKRSCSPNEAISAWSPVYHELYGTPPSSHHNNHPLQWAQSPQTRSSVPALHSIGGHSRYTDRPLPAELECAQCCGCPALHPHDVKLSPGCAGMAFQPHAVPMGLSRAELTKACVASTYQASKTSTFETGIVTPISGDLPFLPTQRSPPPATIRTAAPPYEPQSPSKTPAPLPQPVYTPSLYLCQRESLPQAKAKPGSFEGEDVFNHPAKRQKCGRNESASGLRFIAVSVGAQTPEPQIRPGCAISLQSQHQHPSQYQHQHQHQHQHQRQHQAQVYPHILINQELPAHADQRPPHKRLDKELASAKSPNDGKEYPISEIVSDNGKRKWVVLRPLGKGGCGEVYLGREVISQPGSKESLSSEYVALKQIQDHKQYLSELKTMKILDSHKQGRGPTPKLIASCKKKNVLIMEYLSDTLSKQFERCNYRFSVKTILMLAIDMLEVSRDFYCRTGHVHIDIKPSNYCTGGSGDRLSLIDFGYSTPPQERLPGQTGTPLFMALGIQVFGSSFVAVDPSWQDDLESIGYVLMFFIAGGKRGLPWGHLRTHMEIAQGKSDSCLKEFIRALDTTEYSVLARCLEEHLALTRDRSRPFVPDAHYSILLGNWMNCLVRLGLTYDRKYDWLELSKKSHSDHGTGAATATAAVALVK